MNRGNFSIEHQQEAESFPYGTRDLPHLSVDLTHDTRMPYGTKHLRVMPEIAHNYGKGVTVSREPPREPPRDPPRVFADGSNLDELLPLTPEQKTIIQNALEYANARALEATGFGGYRPPSFFVRWVAIFRQNVSPELLPVVDENLALIKELANMNPDLRVNYIESIVDEIGRSLRRAISSSGKNSKSVYKQIKRSYGGAAAPVPTEPTSCGFRGRGGVRPPNEANYVGRLKTTSGKRARKSEDYRERRREYLNSLTPSQRLQNWAYENQLPDLLGARTAEQQREYNRLQQEVTRIEQVIADLRADPNLTDEQAEEAEEEIMGDLDYLFDDAPVSTDETDEDGVIDEAPRQGDEEDSDDDDDQPPPPYRAPAISVGAGAAPVPTEPKISPFAAAATALQPVRTAIQNGIGDAIYGKEDDPKKQRKGLLGISEEGKEESKKKFKKNVVAPIMKNVVVPIVTTALEMKQDIEDTANMIFNPDKYESDMKERKINQIKKSEREVGIVRDKENPMLIIRKPQAFWTALTSNPEEVAYDTQTVFPKNPSFGDFYVRVPNPLFGIWEKIKKKPSYQDFSKYNILLPWAVQLEYTADGGKHTPLTKELEDEFIFLPEKGLKEFYEKLKLWGRKQLEFTPEGQAKKKAEDRAFFLSKDPRTLSAIDQTFYKKYKREDEEKTLVAAKKKVEADIKAEEAKEAPDTERLAKMKAAKERVLQKEKEFVLRGQEEALRNSYAYKQKVESARVMKEAAAEAARPVAEKIADVKKTIAILEQAGDYDQLAVYNQQLQELEEEQASESVKEQAQGSVDLLQQAQVEGGGLMDCFRPRRRNRVQPLPIEPPYITTPQPEPENPYGRPTYTVPPPPPPPGGAPASPALPNVPQVSGQLTPAARLPPPSPVVGVPASQPLGCSQEHIDIINDALVNAITKLEEAGYDEGNTHFITELGYTPLRALFREGEEGVRTFLNELADEIESDGITPEAISYIRRNAEKICRELIRMCQRQGIDPVVALTDIRDNTLRRARERRGRGVGGAKPTNPALYEKAKAIVNKSYPKHSAYRSGAYVKKYKEMGGEYEDEPDGKRPLERWFKEDWKDVGNKEYPVYRPTKRISKDTPLTPDEIDPENLKLQVKEKQKIRGDRNLSAFVGKGTPQMWADEGFGGDEELEGSGAVEYTIQKAGKSLFNPSGDRSKAGKQSFTPNYEAYGASVAEGRKNAFNLSRSMYNQSKGTELPDFKLVKDDTTIRFYRKNDENVILVGIRGTDVKSWTDLYTWAVIGASQDLQTTARFQGDLAKLVAFQKNYPPSQFYYVAAGHSLAGSIADRFLELGLIKEAITYNPSIEKKFVLDENIRNHRVYLDTDPLFILMGQYAPNTEIRVNPNKTNYYNPIKEKDYLISSHTISPSYNSAFEGGGMEGSGKTYTIEEWKAIFDAKLEQKRKAIEAREAKKKQTAKAKRERAKARRDGRDEPPPLETPFRTSRTMKATPPKEPEPEEEEPEVEVDEYEMGDETYFVEAPREGLAFAERRVFDSNSEEIGNLTEDDVGKTLVKMVMRREKLGAFADKSPKAKSSSESLPSFESKQPKSPEPEEEEDVEVTTYTYKGKEYDIEDPKGADDMNLEFYANRDVWQDDEEIGKLGDDNPLMKGLMKLVIKTEFPSQKDYRETMGLAAKKPRASKAPASARVELREELVAEQPRSPAGQFAEQAETAVVAVSQAPQQAYMKLMKSPSFTEAEKRLLTRIRETKMTPRMRAVLLGRSGLARKVMEMLGIDESAFQSQRARARIADTQERRVKGETVRQMIGLPDDIEVLFQKQEAGLINYIANVMNKKDVGVKIDDLLEKYVSTFVRCGFGCLNLVAEMMKYDPFDVYLAESRNTSCDGQGKEKEKHLTLMMNMTKADENYPSSVSFWNTKTRPYTTMNFSLTEHEGFFLPELTQRCMMRLEGIDGISEVRSTTRNAGMGFKRRNEYAVFFEGVSEEKRFTAAIKEQYSSKIRSEIVPKVFAIARDLKPKMEARGELMRKNVVASLTPAQRKMVEEHNKNKNP